MEIKDLILKLAAQKDKIKTADIINELEDSKSRQHINSIIIEMVKKGELLKGGATAGSFYVLPQNAHLLEEGTTIKLKRESLEEHKVFTSLVEKTPFLKNLPENVSSILYYAFTEMLNNAIDHSQSKYVEINIKKNKLNLTFTINDFGIGVFKNVMQQRNLNSELEAIQDILKGKTTTSPHSHSGEGIFFTSKIADLFSLESFGYRLRLDNTLPDLFIEELKPQKRGTKVTFAITINSPKHLNDVFSQFITEPGDFGFDKTEIQVKLYTTGTIYISRSQARRIMTGLEKFKLVILDFDKVTTVGQAFADEIFRVFQQSHPQIQIKPINMVEPVQFMIERVEKPTAI